MDSDVARVFSKMKGRILTQLEAAISNRQQCEQLKSLVSQIMRDAQRELEYDGTNRAD